MDAYNRYNSMNGADQLREKGNLWFGGRDVPLRAFIIGGYCIYWHECMENRIQSQVWGGGSVHQVWCGLWVVMKEPVMKKPVY